MSVEFDIREMLSKEQQEMLDKVVGPLKADTRLLDRKKPTSAAETPHGEE